MRARRRAELIPATCRKDDMANDDRNLTWHPHQVTKKDRWLRNSHKSALVWLTGLSASGKSTIANELEQALFVRQINTFVLDGDNVRHGLNKDLGFSPEHRRENLRRVGEVARLLVDAGILTIAAFISPYVEERSRIRSLFGEGEFIETYVKCAIDVCEQRDPKGLYKRARRGEVPEFTGVSAPYEEPAAAELVLPTDELTIVQSVERIVDHLERHRIIVGD